MVADDRADCGKEEGAQRINTHRFIIEYGAGACGSDEIHDEEQHDLWVADGRLCFGDHIRIYLAEIHTSLRCKINEGGFEDTPAQIFGDKLHQGLIPLSAERI